MGREKVCRRCRQSACFDVNKKRFRCDSTVATKKQKTQWCGWAGSLFMGSWELFMVHLLHELSQLSSTGWDSTRKLLIYQVLGQQGVVGDQGRMVEIDKSMFSCQKSVGLLWYLQGDTWSFPCSARYSDRQHSSQRTDYPWVDYHLQLLEGLQLSLKREICTPYPQGHISLCRTWDTALYELYQEFMECGKEESATLGL